jgi:hypothetical protein
MKLVGDTAGDRDGLPEAPQHDEKGRGAIGEARVGSWKISWEFWPSTVLGLLLFAFDHCSAHK